MSWSRRRRSWKRSRFRSVCSGKTRRVPRGFYRANGMSHISFRSGPVAALARTSSLGGFSFMTRQRSLIPAEIFEEWKRVLSRGVMNCLQWQGSSTQQITTSLGEGHRRWLVHNGEIMINSLFQYIYCCLFFGLFISLYIFFIRSIKKFTSVRWKNRVKYIHRQIYSS